MRGAVIGCGFFAQNHLNAWRDLGATIVAVCDIDAVRAAETAARHGIARHYTDAEAMLATEQPDFVDIVTTVDTHRPLVELVPAPWTSPDVVPAVRRALSAIGRSPSSTRTRPTSPIEMITTMNR